MTRVKICGLTRFEDALCALEAGAHALGFVLEPTSPRCVASDAEVLRRLDEFGPYVSRVAVFGPAPAFDPRSADFSPPSDPGLQSVPRLAFDTIQSLGERIPNKRFVRVLRVTTESSMNPDLGDCDAVLLDAYSPNQFGGTGERIDWGWAAEFVASCAKPVVLAGGLNPGNVAAAIRRVRPYAVDVASGVEVSPGIKDPDLIRSFIQEAMGT
ncbi:MAG: phosphoribosylanthranilate isomerase [Fimbriimonadaceae bacterium]|nr:phosphoribosylanthranilate isomerase [Fimbriimonadaceae bacterium]